MCTLGLGIVIQETATIAKEGLPSTVLIFVLGIAKQRFDVVRCRSVWVGMGRRGSTWVGVGQCGSMWVDAGRCGSAWVGRCGANIMIWVWITLLFIWTMCFFWLQTVSDLT